MFMYYYAIYMGRIYTIREACDILQIDANPENVNRTLPRNEYCEASLLTMEFIAETYPGLAISIYVA